MKPKKVFVCSPYGGDIFNNVNLAERLCKKVIDEGNAPFAPHLIYPELLDDLNEKERMMGINCGLAYLKVCDEMLIYIGKGISSGMKKEIEFAKENNIKMVEIKEF